jgi:SLAP domain-containing protein
MAFFKKRRSPAEAESPQAQQETAREELDVTNESTEAEPAPQEEQSVDSAEVSEAEEKEAEETDWTAPQTRLVFPEQNREDIPNEQRYVLQFAFSDLPPIPDGQLAINGYKIEQTAFSLDVTAFLRNNTEETVHLTLLPLVILDANQNAVARKVFNLDAFELEPGTAIPYVFKFFHEDIISFNLDLSAWFIGFHMQNGELRANTPVEDPFESNPEYNWAQHVSQEDQEVYRQFQQILEQTQDQVNFIATRIHVSEQDELSVELMLRNGTDESVSFRENMTFTLRDGNSDVIATQAFDLSGISVDPQTVALTTLTFDGGNWIKRDADLSDWTLEVE